MGLCGSSAVPVLGVDISASSVKVLELSARGSGYRVEAYASAPLAAAADSGAATGGGQGAMDVDTVGEAIATAVKRSGSRLKHAAAAVSASQAITKLIQLPAGLSDRNMALQVELEADQYIPFPLEEVNLDFQAVGPSPDNPEMVDVLLAASRHEHVDLRASCLEAAGLIPKIMDIETYAGGNAVGASMGEEYGEAEGHVVAIVDVGSNNTTFTALENGNIAFTREEAFGGHQLTEQIQQLYGLSPDDAEMAKRQGGLPDNYESEVLEPFKQSIGQQIERSIQFLYSSSSISSIDQLLLAGGTCVIPGVVAAVERQVSVPTALANPFTNTSLASRVSERIKADAPALMVCYGLALRSFDE